MRGGEIFLLYPILLYLSSLIFISNPMLKSYLIRLSYPKKHSPGFTLIELLVVIIIIGVLSVIAYPIASSTIGRARETEAKQVLSAIGQGQQTYFWEHGNYATQLNELSVTFEEGYYQFAEPDVLTPNAVAQKATPVNPLGTNTREHELGVYYNSGAFQLMMCQSLNPSTTAEVPNILGAPCVEGRELY